MISDKIKSLREQKKMTQAELSRKLGISRSSVNAWEMGISIPSTQYIIELSRIFKVSTDFLLGVSSTSTIDVSELKDEDIKLLYVIINYMKTP